MPSSHTRWWAAGALVTVGVLGLWFLIGPESTRASPEIWKFEWPNTDFSKRSIAFEEILSGGPPKDGIPSIDDPEFVSAHGEVELGPREPVIALTLNGDMRAYPLRILIWHEIVNDVVGGVPVAVTYCPLCNSAIVFDRRVGGRVLEFGTTGKLRFSDLVMYDRQTESWWQQFLGEAIVGELTGTRLKMLPVRVESFQRFKARALEAKVMGAKVQVPNRPGMRAYGRNPYVSYDSMSQPFLYRGTYEGEIAPLAYVVAIGDRAWALDLLRERGRIEADDLVLTWEAGQNSALDAPQIADGRDIGNVVVQRQTADGLEDEVHDLTFAFVFHAFHPDGVLHVK
ncbi:MAG: DUF3179 domain-containing protein [Kiloniellales bacterium]